MIIYCCIKKVLGAGAGAAFGRRSLLRAGFAGPAAVPAANAAPAPAPRTFLNIYEG